jgi:hypothetical protein
MEEERERNGVKMEEERERNGVKMEEERGMNRAGDDLFQR